MSIRITIKTGARKPNPPKTKSGSGAIKPRPPKIKKGGK